jgi:glycerol-3-phosphate O-acyltransferase
MIPEILGPIRDVFRNPARALVQNSEQPREVSPERVYQVANLGNRDIIDSVLDQLVLPGSHIQDVEQLVELHRRSLAGESCLILMEHYSNFDLPCLSYLLRKQGEAETAESLVAIAGMKLNMQSEFVRAFTEAYTRVVIYPSRSLDQISDPVQLENERKRSLEINMAATRQMIRLKHKGRIVLVFPSGTRYRPGNPDTKRAVKEIDSYIKSFDTMVFVAVAGNVLRINPSGDMSTDLTARDVMILLPRAPESCADFRERARQECPSDADPKQYVADRVMEELDELHMDAEAIRDSVVGE